MTIHQRSVKSERDLDWCANPEAPAALKSAKTSNQEMCGRIAQGTSKAEALFTFVLQRGLPS